MKIKKFLNTILLFEIIFLLQQNIFAAGDELNTVMSIMLVFTVIIIAVTLWLSVVYSEKNESLGLAGLILPRACFQRLAYFPCMCQMQLAYTQYWGVLVW